MAISIVEIHPSEDPKTLNNEWFLVENTGDKPFSTRNCVLVRTRNKSKKRKELGTMDPGFVIKPGEKMRVVTGNPGRKAHGAMPDEEEIANYSLFLNDSILKGKGTVLLLTLRSAKVARAVYDPDGAGGLAGE